MAHRETIQNQDLKDYIGANFFYAVSQSVGFGCPNKPNDVRLVQYLINRFNGRKVLETDGIYGGQTWAKVKEFQVLQGVMKGAGMVSAADGTTYRSRRSGEPYTIYSLNSLFKTYNEMVWTNPRADPWFPKELGAHLWGSLPQLV